jgi:hypothetical protein
MKALADAMAVAGRPLDDDEIISYISAGLGEEFDSLMASLTVYNTPVTLTDFYAFLLSYEARQVLRQTQEPEYNSSANNVNRIGGFSTTPVVAGALAATLLVRLFCKVGAKAEATVVAAMVAVAAVATMAGNAGAPSARCVANSATLR